MSKHRVLAPLFFLLAATPCLAAADNADIPSDAPVDAIMAQPAELQAAVDWTTAAFGGGTGASDSFLAPSLPFSFRYDGADSRALMATWKRTAVTQDLPDRVKQTVTWNDPKTALAVTAVVTTFKRYPAVDWVLYFENQGQQDTPILEDIRALDATLRTADAKQPAVLHQLMGDDCNDRAFLPFETSLEAGKQIGMAPRGGRPSCATAFPFFNFRYQDQGVIAAVGWTGQWAASFDRAADGPTRLQAGMEKTHLVLQPGEKIRSPRILLMPWKGDRTAAHQRFRRLLMFCYAPRPNGKTPLQLPFAMQCFDRYFRTQPAWSTEAGQLAAVKATHQIGCDYHWLDAAWFPLGFPNGAGTWSADPQKFPNGLKPITDLCHQLGMKFILWFEPERVAADTQIAKEHPEFVFGGGNAGLFKLNEPAARRWLTDLLSQRIAEWGLDVYRNDFNLDPLCHWQGNDSPDRQGITEIRYVEGLYAMWDELIAKHPGLWIDNCASGGRRIDLEMCMRSAPLWRSDTSCSPDHPEWDQRQTAGLSMYIPLFTACDWSPDSYETRSKATAGMIAQFDYQAKGFSMDDAKAAVAEAKENQKYWYGDFYPITSATMALDQWAAYQMHRADLDAGIVLAFRRSESPYLTLLAKFGGVDPAKHYAVEFIDDARQKTEKTLTGRELVDGLEIRLPQTRSSVLVRYHAVN